MRGPAWTSTTVARYRDLDIEYAALRVVGRGLFLAVMLASIVGNWWAGLRLERAPSIAFLIWAVAGNLATVAQLIYLQFRLRHRNPLLGVAPVLPDLIKVGVATLLMSAVVALVWRAGAGFVARGKAAEALGLLVTIGVGAAVCGGLLWVMRIQGRDDLVAMLRRRAGRVN